MSSKAITFISGYLIQQSHNFPFPLRYDVPGRWNTAEAS
jgi:hypothetical protein